MLIRNSEPPKKQFITGERPEVPGTTVPETSVSSHNAYDVFEAAQLEYNFAAAGIRKLMESTGPEYEIEADLDYSPFSPENEAEIEGYPPGLFIKSQSRQETEAMKIDFDKGVERQKILDEAGAYGTLNLVGAGLFNPLALVPLFGWGAGRVSNGVQGMVKGAAYAGGAEAVNEALLHAMENSRTYEDTVANITGVAIFGGLLGGVIGKASGYADELMSAEAKFLEEHRSVHFRLRGDPDKTIEEIKPGVYEIVNKALKDRTPVDRIKGAVPRAIAHLTPIRALASRNPLTRIIASHLGEQTVVGTDRAAIETLLNRMEGDLQNAYKIARRGYHDLAGQPGYEKYTYREFQEQVSSALRNGDVHENPQIEAAAKGYRKLLNQMKDEAVEVGLLKGSDNLVKFADSYFPRIYHIGKMRHNPSQFKTDLVTWLTKDNPKLKTEDAEEIARQVYRDLTTNHYQTEFHRAFVPTAGPLKGRELAIPDNVLAPYLVNEPEAVVRQYTRHVGARIQLHKRFGNDDLKDAIEEVEDEWVRMIDEASADGASQASIRRMNRARERDVTDLRIMRDRLLNRYGIPEDPSGMFTRVNRGVRNLNALRLLGGMTLSSFPDVARPIWKHGLMPYMRGIMKVATNSDLRKMSKEDLHRMGVGLDLVFGQRLRAIAELDYNPYGVSRAEQILEGMTQGTGTTGRLMAGENIPDMGRFTLMSYWNSSLKMLSGVLSQDGFLRKVVHFKKYAKDLSRAGIDEDMARRIAQQYKKYGNNDKGMLFGDSSKWDDIDAAEAFEAAILKEVETTIVTPGILDRPRWMSNEMGKTVGQLKSFAFASTNRQLLAGISQADARVFQGILASTTMGAVSLVVKGLIAGKTYEEITGNDPAEFLWSSMEHSGAIGIGSELSDIAQSALGENANQYSAERTLEGKILGPTAGTAQEMLGTAYGDVESMRRLIPYNNLFYVRRFFDKAVENAEANQ